MRYRASFRSRDKLRERDEKMKKWRDDRRRTWGKTARRFFSTRRLCEGMERKISRSNQMKSLSWEKEGKASPNHLLQKANMPTSLVVLRCRPNSSLRSCLGITPDFSFQIILISSQSTTRMKGWRRPEGIRTRGPQSLISLVTQGSFLVHSRFVVKSEKVDVFKSYSVKSTPDYSLPISFERLLFHHTTEKWEKRWESLIVDTHSPPYSLLHGTSVNQSSFLYLFSLKISIPFSMCFCIVCVLKEWLHWENLLPFGWISQDPVKEKSCSSLADLKKRIKQERKLMINAICNLESSLKRVCFTDWSFAAEKKALDMHSTSNGHSWFILCRSHTPCHVVRSYVETCKTRDSLNGQWMRRWVND